MEDRKILIKKYIDIASLGSIIILGVLMRIIPHPPNFAPVGGLVLFSGAHLAGLSAFVIPLLVMLISDMVIGFHSTMIHVYFSFALIVLVGRLIGKKRQIRNLLLASFSSSILFFIITNFGVWTSAGIYPKSVSGLINCYQMGLPFFRNTFLGDLFYTFGFFYGYRILFSFINRIVGKFSLSMHKFY